MGFPNLPPLTSEELEPVMVKVMCHLYAACERARTENDGMGLETACNTLWEGMRAISMVSICIRNCFPHDANCCLHFSLAASNEMAKAAKYIEETLGLDPYKVWWNN